jgi:hypothetical protein
VVVAGFAAVVVVVEAVTTFGLLKLPVGVQLYVYGPEVGPVTLPVNVVLLPLQIVTSDTAEMVGAVQFILFF